MNTVVILAITFVGILLVREGYLIFLSSKKTNKVKAYQKTQDDLVLENRLRQVSKL